MNFLRKVLPALWAQGRHPLNRQSSALAAWNFAIAQLASRAVPGDICVDFPNGSRLLVPPHMKGAAHFIHPGLCEFEDMSFVMHFVRPGELFVDAGANIGAYTVLASAAIGAQAIAFEPNPSTFRALTANVALNSIGQLVKTVNTALGQSEGRLQMTDGRGTENCACANGQPAAGTVSVPMATLDKALAGQNPVLLKMDVEGFESAVFTGAAQTLAAQSLKAMIIERNGAGAAYGFDEDALHKNIRDHGFRPCAYAPFTRTLSEIASNASGNILYIRDLIACRQRLKTAPAFRFKDFTI